MKHTSATTQSSSSEGGYAGLTEQGCRKAVSTYAELEGDREGVGAQRQSLCAMLGALVRKDGPVEPNELESYYKPARQDVPKQGHYGGHRFPQFFEDVARPQLLAVPGVEESGGHLQFVGIETKEISVPAADTRPLDDIRDDPRSHAKDEIADLVGAHSEKYEVLVGLWDYVANSGHITNQELKRLHRYELTEKNADILARLPAIERVEESPPDPEDIPISTYADVLDAQEALKGGHGQRVVWRYAGEGSD